MKVFAIVGFLVSVLNSSSASAAPSEYVCRAKSNSSLAAWLSFEPTLGWVSTLLDGYETVRSGSNLSWMACKNVGETLQCSGKWSFSKVSTTVIFAKDESGQLWARFKRGTIGNHAWVNLKCSQGQ